MGDSSSGPLVNRLKESMFSTMEAREEDVAKYANQKQLNEQEMIQFNLAVSKYRLATDLTSSLVKNLTDGEKSIAQKM